MDRGMYVYAIGADEAYSGLELATKIGVSKHPETRLEQMQTGSPVHLTIRATWRFVGEREARDFEVACHKKFKDRHLKLEWYLVSVEEIADFHEFYRKSVQFEEEFNDVMVALSKRKGTADWRAVEAVAARVKIAEKLKKAADAVPTIDSTGSGLMTTQQAANYIQKSSSWLNKSRMTGMGPVYSKNGGAVRYKKEDLDAWIITNRRSAVYDFANGVTH